MSSETNLSESEVKVIPPASTAKAEGAAASFLKIDDGVAR